MTEPQTRSLIITRVRRQGPNIRSFELMPEDASDAHGVTFISGQVAVLAVGGEEPAAYGPGMRQMARYQKQYPLGEFVSHRYKLRDVHAAVQKSLEPGSLKVVLEPWS